MTPEPPPPVRSPRRWRWLLLLILILGAGIAAWSLQPRDPEPPAVPTGTEAEVASAISNSRSEVLADRRNAASWGQLGMMFTAHGFDDEAASCYREAHRLDPADGRWPYLLGLFYLSDVRDPAEARRLFEASFACRHQSEKHEEAVRLRLAEADLAEHRLDEAERLFREQLARDPASPRANLGLGLTLLEAGRPADAKVALLRATTSPTTRRRARTSLAAVSRVLNDPASAEENERLVATLPDDLPPPDPFMAAAASLKVSSEREFEEIAALEKSGRISDAIPRLSRMVQDPANTRASLLLGQYLALLGQPAAAEPHIRHVLERDPENGPAALLLATTLYDIAKQERNDDRRKQLLRESADAAERAIQRQSNPAVAQFSRATALKDLGETDRALSHFRLAVEIRPEVAQFQLSLLAALIESKRAAEARTRLPIVERVVPKDAPELNTLRKQLAELKP